MNNPKGVFKDPTNPTRTELKVWAYGDYSDPMPDFQLFATKDPYIALDLAVDPRCPKRDFFLESLYVWMGDQVRARLPEKKTVEDILTLAEELPDGRIEKFIKRSRELILDPESYDSDKWGIGGSYVRE